MASSDFKFFKVNNARNRVCSATSPDLLRRQSSSLWRSDEEMAMIRLPQNRSVHNFLRTLKSFSSCSQMPRSKRSKLGQSILNGLIFCSKSYSKIIVSLTKVSKKTKEHKNAMMTEVGYIYFIWSNFYSLIVQQLTATSQFREMAVLLAFWCWIYAECSSQNRPKSMERVCLPFIC